MKHIYPKNKEQFLKLIGFGKKVVNLCNQLDIIPLVHGSLAVFYYTKDTNLKINDIDFLIPEKFYPKIIKKLKEKKIKHKYIEDWKVLQIFKDKLKIEIDSIEFNPKDKRKNRKILKDLKISLDSMEYHYKDKEHNGLPKDFKDFEFEGLKCKILSLKSLKKFYKMAYERSTEDKVKLKDKLNILYNIK